MINASKSISTNYSIKHVADCIKNLPNHTESATLNMAIDSVGYFQFFTTGKGSYKDMVLEIALHPINEHNTTVFIELRDKEYIHADTRALSLPYHFNYVNGCISLLSKLLSGEKK